MCVGFLASLKMLDSFKLFAFYLRCSSGVGESSGTGVLHSLNVKMPEEMFEGHETCTLLTLKFHILLY